MYHFPEQARLLEKISRAAISNQHIMSKFLDMGLVHGAKTCRDADASLTALYALTYRQMLEGARKYDPDQPRVPAGYEGGGQWTDDPRWAAPQRVVDDFFEGVERERHREAIRALDNAFQPEMNDEEIQEAITREAQLINDPPLEPVYPVENIMATFTGLQALNALRTMMAGRAAVAASSRRVQQAEKAIKDYLGGPGKFDRNKVGDPYIININGDKKVRFDINRTYPHDKPHFHIQHRTIHGNWRNTGKQRYEFKE